MVRYAKIALMVLVALLMTPVLAAGPESRFYMVPTDKMVYTLATFDAAVYQDGTYTIAVNRTGGIINATLISAHSDDVPIQAAIDYGSSVEFDTNKTYIIDRSLNFYGTRAKHGFTMDLHGSTLKAGPDMGSSATIHSPNFAFSVLWFTDSTGITIKNGIIDGNNRPGINCIAFATTDPVATTHDILISDMELKNAYLWNSGDIYAQSTNGRGIASLGSDRVTVENSYIHDCGVGINFEEYGSASVRRDNKVIGCNIKNITMQSLTSYMGIGIYISGNSGTIVDHTTISNCTDNSAIWVGESETGADGFILSDSVLTRNYEGLHIGGLYKNIQTSDNLFSWNSEPAINSQMTGIISDNIFYNNGQNAATDGQKSAIWISPTSTYLPDIFVDIHGNKFYDDQAITTQKYAYYHVPTVSGGNYLGANIFDNVMENTTSINITPYGGGSITHTVKRNIGYVTENKGTALSVSDGGTINHGLVSTPTWCGKPSGTIPNETVTVTSMGATTITVAIKKNSDGSAGTTQNVSWECEV